MSNAGAVSVGLQEELDKLSAIENTPKLRPWLIDQQLRTASLVLTENEREVARNILIEATSNLSALIGDKEFGRHEKKALRTLGGREEEKFFLGDPYEQMFAFLYLGILDYQLGEYEMARASFLSAQIADEGSRVEGYKADCYLAFLLEGMADLAMGRTDLADEAFQFATRSYRFRHYMKIVQNAFTAGTQKNFNQNMDKKEALRAGMMLEWVTQ